MPARRARFCDPARHPSRVGALNSRTSPPRRPQRSAAPPARRARLSSTRSRNARRCHPPRPSKTAREASRQRLVHDERPAPPRHERPAANIVAVPPLAISSAGVELRRAEAFSAAAPASRAATPSGRGRRCRSRRPVVAKRRGPVRHVRPPSESQRATRPLKAGARPRRDAHTADRVSSASARWPTAASVSGLPLPELSRRARRAERRSQEANRSAIGSTFCPARCRVATTRASIDRRRNQRSNQGHRPDRVTGWR